MITASNQSFRSSDSFSGLHIVEGLLHIKKKGKKVFQDSEFESLYSTWEGSQIDFLLCYLRDLFFRASGRVKDILGNHSFPFLSRNLFKQGEFETQSNQAVHHLEGLRQ